MKTAIEITIEFVDPHLCVITNQNGDTFSFNPDKHEGFASFLTGASQPTQKNNIEMAADYLQKVLSEMNERFDGIDTEDEDETLWTYFEDQKELIAFQELVSLCCEMTKYSGICQKTLS